MFTKLFENKRQNYIQQKWYARFRALENSPRRQYYWPIIILNFMFQNKIGFEN